MRQLRFVIGALAGVLSAAPLAAQTGSVRGRVVDNTSQQPLPGVQVSYGTHITQTSMDGRYIISGLQSGMDTLKVRMLGYEPAARAVFVTAGQTVDADFSLTAQAVSLSEIVVVGYGQQRAGDITGAVAAVDSSQFNTGTIVSPAQLIQAKVAGVEVADNNEPGGGNSIRIRGATSITAASDPLYVVDGVPLGTGSGGGLSTGGRDPLDFLNPDDIASITVLRDASAAAIYGSNAANGVVLITTKSGSGHQGTPTFTYSGSFVAASVTRTPDVLSAAQFRTAVQTYAPGRVAMLGSASNDWFSQIDRTGYGQQHDFSLTGSGTNSSYRLSATYLQDNGVIQNSSTQRLTAGLNYDQRLFNDHLDVKLNMRGARSYDLLADYDAIGNAVSFAPTQPVLDPTSATGYWDWNTTAASASNPVSSIALTVNHATTWRSVGNMQADYHLPSVDGLSANLNLAYDYANTNQEQFIPNDRADQTRQGHGYLNLANQFQLNGVLEMYLNYAPLRTYGPGTVDITGGYSYTQSHAEYPSLSETGLSTNLLGDAGTPTATTVTPSQYVNDYKLISFFGRFNYNIKDRYLAAFTLRRDGSSRFGSPNAWGVFPSVALAWRLSSEPFFSNMHSLSDLKLRGTWARTGNQSIGDYLQYATYVYGNAGAQYQFGNQFITTIRPNPFTPNIQWEQTNSYNVGVDYGFWNQRVSGSVDWYTKNTSNLLFYTAVPAGSNFSNFATENIGSMRNRGIELSLDAVLKQPSHGSIGWTADFTASNNSNTLLSINPGAGSQQIRTGGIAGGVGTTIQVLEPGQPIYSFWVCPQAYGSDGKPLEGQFVDTTGAVVNGCDARSLKAEHDPAPKWIFGHTSNLTYGHWDMSFTLRAYTGNYTYNNVASSTGVYNQTTNGGSPSNMSSSVLKTGFVTPQYLSDIYVESASFLRMDNITLGYKFHYQGTPARVYATLQNAFTITGYSGVDPTAGLNGIDNNIYPRARTLTTGLQLTF